MTVAILGVFVADTTFRAPRQPVMGETILGTGFALGPGGKGSNQAVACAKAGGAALMVTRIGADTFGDMALDAWGAAGVDAVHVERGGTPTGAAYIFVDEATGDNAIIVYPGAAGTMDAAFVDERADAFRRADVVMTQLEQPMGAAMRALALGREGGAATLLNPAPAAPLPDGMLALCDYVTPNETEAEAITGRPVGSEEEARAAAARLLEMGVAKAAILTLGERGALYHAADGTSEMVPAFQAGPVVETTGAGDAFNGGFAAALSGGMAPLDAVRFGCATASLSVTRPGAAVSMPTRAEIDALLG
ncbi:ribokinase [Jannaschia sp. Os4]|uniref:ribokinase n=1 Tax=Jannaschia sp. Os4 TaxID=2807617 RepID=UPI00193A0945|nr:ribokinase [Jannaschia sp. Os4]MBM2575027.1 ribokinase [Jannaschia sp. Os4]